MEALVALLAIAAIVVLEVAAVGFGVDSRPGYADTHRPVRDIYV